ncbi:hypothetical protein [Dyadobacter sp.]|uniref:hypothetical protein n=1 Tax=Dyadobacter sp. TaxID=1914288 RepID=UPI003F6FFFFA
MDIKTEKIELAKRLLNTSDERIIKAVKSVFENFDNEYDWSDLPDIVIHDVNESLKQIELGNGISHEDALRTYQKWL